MCASFPIPDGTVVTPVDADGVAALWVTASDADDRRAVIHLHGGAYVVGSAHDYREYASALSHATGGAVLLVDYRLAPEHPHPAAVDDALATYRWLARDRDEETIAICGDSAGGGLALAVLMALRDAGDPLPAAAALISPFTDLTGESCAFSPDPRTAQAIIQLSALYLAGHDPRETPLASPLHGDLSGLVPMLVQVASREALLHDATSVVDAIRAAGGDADLAVADGMPHDWPLFSSFLPEGRDAFRRIGEHFAIHLSARPTTDAGSRS